MALKGQLSDFNLAEILQLIATQQKTGFLILEIQPQLVFVFEKGILISTRDRRNESHDPLERFLQTYGFFDPEQWKHIDFIRKNSSLDLTEILLSERMLTQEGLEKVLRSLALEMTHHGMKLKRGRYYFTSTKDTPHGVRGRLQLDVQSLLMESARRLDEEANLDEKFPSPLILFQKGDNTPEPDDLDPVKLRLFQLALAGDPLGQIIRKGQVDSFATREKLQDCCVKGFLIPVMPDQHALATGGNSSSPAESENRRPLRSVPFSIMVVLLALGIGFWRWEPVFTQEPAAGPASEAATSVQISADESASPARSVRELRLRQIREQVVQAAELFKYRFGNYPRDLSRLVEEGLLEAETFQQVVKLDWKYKATGNAQAYQLDS